MSIVKTDSIYYENIASKVREKTGTTTEYKPNEMPSGIDEVYEAGKKAEYDAFWGSYLNKYATDCSMLFAGNGWNDSTFNPGADIIPSFGSAERMFAMSKMTDIEAALKRNNVILDLSRCNRFDYSFYYCRSLTCVPEIVIGKDCTKINNMFSECTALRTIRKLTFSDNTLNTSYAFGNCIALEEITIGGTIACDGLSLQYSPKLNKASITSFINALSATTSGFTITFSETAVNNAFSADEWATLVATKPNWTISLV